MKKRLFLLLIFFWAIPSGFAQLKSYSFEEVEKLASQNPKPILVFVHTNWCKYCEMMENSTLKNPEIVSMLNNNFYFISLDAETKTDICFQNHTFKFQPTGQNTGIHELATALASIEGQVVYPTLSFLDSDYSILFQKHSYQQTKKLFATLQKMEEYFILRKNTQKKTLEL